MKRKPAIALISKSDARGGGASSVAHQLHRLLQADDRYRADHWNGEASPAPLQHSLRGSLPSDLVYRGSRHVSRLVGVPDFYTLSLPTASRTFRNYNLYHAHDISGTISPLSLGRWGRRAPLVWTFHDCSPFTGGCTYPASCEAFLSRCQQCPQLGRWPLVTLIDRTGYMQSYKLGLINNIVRRVICPSRWIAGEAARAGVRHHLLRVIPNAVDTNTFHPSPRKELRKRLGLPIDGNIVLLLSMNMANPYKGTPYALAALANQEPGLNALIVGDDVDRVQLPHGPNYIVRERTFDRNLLASYYAACDVILFPSLAENAPLVLLEAMASGTPAVAFDTGGIGEIVSHMVDGWLAPQGETQALSLGLKSVLDNKTFCAELGRKSRETILQRHTEAAFLKAHLDVYDELIAETHAHAANPR